MAGHFGQGHGRARSAGILAALGRVETAQVMDHASSFPVVLRKAAGARVTDADGNRYVDLGSFFGVALVGHKNPAVVKAIRVQAGRLLHGMGDVHPPDVKYRFLRRLAAAMPGPDYKGVLSLNGSDAVETALKFAAAATGRPGVAAFSGSYHGLSLGALEVTAQDVFRRPFRHLLSSSRVAFFPFPTNRERAGEVTPRIRAALKRGTTGAVIVEPIQGRGGIRVPAPGFLAELSAMCRDHGAALIVDEIYTGCGRTGTFLAVEHEGVAPDAVCVGKALGGGVPLSVCMMKRWLADAVQGTPTEAVHTSTFLGHPLGCAAGLAVLREIERKDLLRHAVRLGDEMAERAARWKREYGRVVLEIRGRGAMVGVKLAGDAASRVAEEALKRGVIVLPEGEEGDVLALMPPLVISDADLDFALGVVGSCIREVAS